MKTFISLLALSLGFCVSAPAPPAAEPPKIVNETISGWSFRAIAAAEAELKRLGLYVDDYQIFVRRQGSFLVVLFGSPADVDVLKIGCAPAPRDCLTVQLSVEDFRVIRSEYGAQNR
jgi:hypothetical protein